MKTLTTIIREELFKYNEKNQEQKDNIFNLFKSSYEKAIGTSWSREKFNSRVYNWQFYGDENGFIAIRPQKSGFQKLVGVGGSGKSILKGFDELNSKNLPVWGMVSFEIAALLNKKGYKTPPSFVLKFILKMIPANVFNGAEFKINKDGSITINYSDVGEATKYFVANDYYFKKIKTDFWHLIEEKIKTLPLIGKNLIKSFFKAV
jgi:hypothetical protein